HAARVPPPAARALAGALRRRMAHRTPLPGRGRSGHRRAEDSGDLREPQFRNLCVTYTPRSFAAILYLRRARGTRAHPRSRGATNMVATAEPATASFSLDLNEDQVQLQKWVHEFAETVVRPAAHEWDEREETPWPII